MSVARHEGSAIALTFATVLTGCMGEEPAYLAEYDLVGLTVLSYDHDRVCQGSLDALEAENQRIRDLVGTADAPDIRVLVGQRAVDEFCGVGTAGCSSRSRNGQQIAIGDGSVLAHEIVHAQRQQVAAWRKPFFLEEGLAYVASAGRLASFSTLSDRTLDLSAALELPLSDLDLKLRLDGSHFVFWLFEEFGQDATIAMFSDQNPDAKVVLETHFGADLEALRQQWHDGTEPEIRGSTICGDIPVYDLSAPLDVELDLACEVSGVRGPLVKDGVPVNSRLFCLDIAQAGGATIEVQSAGGPADIKFSPEQGDCPFSEDYPGSTLEKRVESGESEDVSFGACRWIGRIEAELESASIVRVTVTPL